MVNSEAEKEVLNYGHWFNGLKNTWSSDDLIEAYNLYNRINGTNKKDVGCPSCRREVIDFLRDTYLRLRNRDKLTENNNN